MPRNPLSNFEKKLRKEIANNLKTHTKGITQQELSEMTGIPTSTLSGYFAERSTINAGNSQKIADALKIDKQDIDPRFKEAPWNGGNEEELKPTIEPKTSKATPSAKLAVKINRRKSPEWDELATDLLELSDDGVSQLIPIVKGLVAAEKIKKETSE